MSQKPWYRDGLRFHCTECGNCCTGAPGYVWVNKAEIEELAALLEVDMSLGEYTYIYAVAYGPTILGTETGEQDATGDAHLSARVRGTLRRQLSNRLAAMDERPEKWEDTEERSLLVEEVAVLEDHLERLPWCDVRPPALQTSLAAYDARLAELFCPDATHLELTRTRSFGIGILSD